MIKRYTTEGKRKVSQDGASNWNQMLERVGESQDKEAFAGLFAHFAPLLKGFLLKAGGITPEQAEELVQETMIKVWRKAPSYSSKQASASTWMYTIARNTRIDWLRKHTRYITEELSADEMYNDQDDDETPYSSLVEVRNRKNIRDHMSTLPQEQLQVLSLMYFQGKSGQEVANELSIPLGTVKSRVRLALQKLKLLVGNADEVLA